MRFKIDENLPVEIAEILRDRKFDADTVKEENLSGKSDEYISEVCLRENRILVTLDLDFSDTRVYPPDKYPGFIVIRLKNQSKNNIIIIFSKMIPFLQKENVQNRLAVLKENKIRIR